ncbi:L,D-transpeptidase [Allosaccharopolyspora coralli]|nr:L,D-transpeptidase [Allosaccharopolyspora coralli]
MLHRRARDGRRPMLAGALLLALLTGCGSAPAPPAAAPEQPPAQARVVTADLPEATTFGDLSEAPADPAPQQPTDGTVLRVHDELALYDAPDGEPFARLPATQLENPTWVPVVETRGQWSRVLLPSRPTGATGWVRPEPGQAEPARSPYEVEVDVDAMRMVVRESGREIGSWTVGVGGEGTPTPRGRTYMMAAIEETVTTFSPVILPLGTHSQTLTSYGGGPGTVALHGWPDSSVFGTASSDGCVRVPDDALDLLTTLPLGTLVLLR